MVSEKLVHYKSDNYFVSIEMRRTERNEVIDDFIRFQKDFSGLINYERDQIKYGGKHVSDK